MLNIIKARETLYNVPSKLVLENIHVSSAYRLIKHCLYEDFLWSVFAPRSDSESELSLTHFKILIKQSKFSNGLQVVVLFPAWNNFF